MLGCFKNKAARAWIKAVGENGDASLVDAPPNRNFNRVDKCGMTALMWACKCGHLAIIEALLAAPGINVNKRGKDRYTAAHEACSANHGDPRVVKLLALHGADMTARNHWHWTPLHYAASWNKTCVTSFLLTLPEVCDALAARSRWVGTVDAAVHGRFMSNEELDREVLMAFGRYMDGLRESL